MRINLNQLELMKRRSPFHIDSFLGSGEDSTSFSLLICSSLYGLCCCFTLISVLPQNYLVRDILLTRLTHMRAPSRQPSMVSRSSTNTNDGELKFDYHEVMLYERHDRVLRI